MTKLKTTKTRGPGAYTIVSTQGAADYLPPHDPLCPPSQRYLPVHRVDGGGWGIVDRRTGRLLAETRPDEHRYTSWQEVQAVVGMMNDGARVAR